MKKTHSFRKQNKFFRDPKVLTLECKPLCGDGVIRFLWFTLKFFRWADDWSTDTVCFRRLLWKNTLICFLWFRYKLFISSSKISILGAKNWCFSNVFRMFLFFSCFWLKYTHYFWHLFFFASLNLIIKAKNWSVYLFRVFIFSVKNF